MEVQEGKDKVYRHKGKEKKTSQKQWSRGDCGLSSPRMLLAGTACKR